MFSDKGGRFTNQTALYTHGHTWVVTFKVPPVSLKDVLIQEQIRANVL